MCVCLRLSISLNECRNPSRSESVGSPGARVTVSCELPCVCWEPNMGPLQGPAPKQHHYKFIKRLKSKQNKAMSPEISKLNFETLLQLCPSLFLFFFQKCEDIWTGMPSPIPVKYVRYLDFLQDVYGLQEN